jgi:2-polyprenyl-6-hydroxyphenyl methylase/3-demethylubiquinone-9 3-methyltransferase
MPFAARSHNEISTFPQYISLDNLRGGPAYAVKMKSEPASAPEATLDPREVDRFQRLSSEWWNPSGKFRPLHQQGRARLTFIRDTLVTHFGLPPKTLKPLRNITILDIGCGGGLVCEPLARLGGRVTGIDPTADSIEIARRHAEAQRLAIDYRAARAEELSVAGETFDAVVCLEVIEHVPDVAAFLKVITKLVRPGGALVLSTLNRTWKSYGLAIVAAEYVLGWLPRGTHNWLRFVTPEELGSHISAVGLAPPQFRGMVYDVIRDEWRLDADTGVNYLAATSRPA